MAGSLRKKLDWAKILADSNRITLTIADSTLATGSSPCPLEGDVEQGGSMGLDLFEQRNAYLHIDVFRMDQVIRNMITNAVRYGDAIVVDCSLSIYSFPFICDVTHHLVLADEVHPRWRKRKSKHLM